MGAIFANLHDQGVDQQQLLKCVEEIPITDGMKELLQHASQKGHECIIISDSNSKFINQILQRYNLEECVSVVYTNPASFDENGILTIEKYHTQNWCDMSTVNLCKGNVLEQHIYIEAKSRCPVFLLCLRRRWVEWPLSISSTWGIRLHLRQGQLQTLRKHS